MQGFGTNQSNYTLYVTFHVKLHHIIRKDIVSCAVRSQFKFSHHITFQGSEIMQGFGTKQSNHTLQCYTLHSMSNYTLYDVQ